MELTTLLQHNIPQKKIDQLKKAKLTQLEDLLYLFPKKYIDRTQCTGIQPEGESVILFQCESVRLHNSRAMLIEATGKMPGSDIQVRILWFNQVFLHTEIRQTVGKTILVAGIAKYMQAEPLYNKPERIEFASPSVYDPAGMAGMKIYPAYKKIPGMAEDYLQKLICLAMDDLMPMPETIPDHILQKNGLISHAEMIRSLHAPSSAAALDAAIRRKRWEDLLYFALRIEINCRKTPAGSIYGLPSLAEMNRVRDSLPFRLTAGQEKAICDAIEHIRTGRRLNALIQGDVGCGKTVIAQLLMIAFASNGYQAALMAPTKLLAQQHYEGLCKLCEPLNIPVLFVGGGGKQKVIAQQLASGQARLIVGTQALLEEKYQFKNLALVVEDEEHKYGVLQRAALAEKAAGGTHTITMSATPIPRSLAQTIYGDSLQLFTIREKPAGRKPVLTGITPNETKAIAFLKRICAIGQQAYVVCPMIAQNEKMEGVASAEKVFTTYEAALKQENLRVALITGKTPKNTADTILQQFESGDIAVLVSTTVIEVGINVPNATCMIIHSAERFGLAQLHQLRGRVGRGSADAYCSLISADASNPRLQAMVKTNDGFEIARMDLEQRGAGDFLGTQQSGIERYLALALQNPEEYANAQLAAKELLDSCASCLLLEKAIEDTAAEKGGDVLQVS